jgi:hypothetical protein
MYPVDVSQLIRSATLGSRGDDPTLPVKPPPLAWLRARLRPLPATLTAVRLTSPRYSEAPLESCSGTSSRKAA